VKKASIKWDFCKEAWRVVFYLTDGGEMTSKPIRSKEDASQIAVSINERCQIKSANEPIEEE